MFSAHKLSVPYDVGGALVRKTAPVFLLLAMVFGTLSQTAIIGRAQTNLLKNGTLAPSPTVTPGSAQAAPLVTGNNSTFIPNWTVFNWGQTDSTGALRSNNYAVNGNPASNASWIPQPSATMPSTFSVQLDSQSAVAPLAPLASAPSGNGNLIAYNNTIVLVANARYDLSFYLNSETSTNSNAPPQGRAGDSAFGTLRLNATGASLPGLTIANVTMANAGAATGSNVATGFGYSVSGTTVSLTAPTTLSGADSTTQPWVKVDIVFTTTSTLTLPAGSIAYEDSGDSTSSNNSSVADFALVQVVPEIPDWRVIAGFCIFCVGFGSTGKLRRANRLILKSGG
ncbi:MAG: hypothetical protein JO076_08665 [Verrucomicrobia bacterium]|nr:hypothetical protein [Verrucomicrobiota bacterium]